MTDRRLSTGVIGFIGLLTVTFFVLKLTGRITWPWIWVLALQFPILLLEDPPPTAGDNRDIAFMLIKLTAFVSFGAAYGTFLSLILQACFGS